LNLGNIETLPYYTTKKTKCLGCGSEDILVAFEEKYHGFRGTCQKCGANWPES